MTISVQPPPHPTSATLSGHGNDHRNQSKPQCRHQCRTPACAHGDRDGGRSRTSGCSGFRRPQHQRVFIGGFLIQRLSSGYLEHAGSIEGEIAVGITG
ncbi:hypothetical protein DPMN_188060 [Dreissena polymorpha]|uniref:Uncharacterized protein n=1 Tax=Dreissena polymorpha TaxID=45954 RepID=A0A9D4DT71_DREPO|nr:hypothetical protein DPMN_188060 [Dreissena polymorpha]